MTGKAKTYPKHQSSAGIFNLRQVYDCWQVAVARAEDNSLSEKDMLEACAVARDCERLAMALPVVTADDLAIKAKLALADVLDGKTDLQHDAEVATEAFLAAPDPDREILRHFQTWEALQSLHNLPCMDNSGGDHVSRVSEHVSDIAAEIPARSAHGLALKLIMSLDLGMGIASRAIVASTRRDIERFAGYPMADL